jgi:hypothetical protein
MGVELNTLINKFDCWEYVPHPGKNVLPSTWAFKIELKRSKRGFVLEEIGNKRG